MPADWDLPALQQLWSDEEDAAVARDQELMRDCERCSRPKSVCLCPWMPAVPLQTAGRIVILQHPLELKKRLATVPLLQKCLGDVAVVRARRFQPGKPEHAAFEQALQGAAAGRYPLLVLFPGANARDVQEVAAELYSHSGGTRGSCSSGCAGGQHPGGQQCEQHDVRQQLGEQQQESVQQAQQRQDQDAQQQAAAQPPSPPSATAAQEAAGEADGEPLYLLLVIDGTWKQAKEMFNALRTYALQPVGPGIRVQLPPLVPTQQAQQEGAPDEGSCAQEEGPAAAGAVGAAAVQQQASQHVAAAQAAAEQRGAGEPETAAAAAAAAGAPEAAAAGAPEAEKPVLLRMEPLEGCLTTCEAVARALGALEGPRGPAVRDAILQPLAQLAHFQAQWNPSLAARLESGSGYSQARRRMGLSRVGDLAAIA